MNQDLLGTSSSAELTRKTQPLAGEQADGSYAERLPHAVAAFHCSNGLLWPL